MPFVPLDYTCINIVLHLCHSWQICISFALTSHKASHNNNSHICVEFSDFFLARINQVKVQAFIGTGSSKKCGHAGKSKRDVTNLLRLLQTETPVTVVSYSSVGHTNNHSKLYVPTRQLSIKSARI